MKILLTGPSGFIGSAFVKLALARGHQVAGLVIPSEPVPDIPPAEGLSWLRGTLEQAPWDAIAAFAPDACVHMAWITTPGVYLESPENERFRDSSLVFLRKVRQLGASHIVGLGTCVEYQITDKPLSEASTPVAPTTLYARCKNELRLALEQEARSGAFEFCWARVFYPYGPGEHPSRLCSSIIAKLARAEKIFLKTPHSTKDYIYIEDLAGAILTLLQRRASGPVNLGTGVGASVREIANCIASLMGKPGLVQEASPPEPDPFPFVVAENARLRAFGWHPQWTMNAGLARLVQQRTGSAPAQPPTPGAR